MIDFASPVQQKLTTISDTEVLRLKKDDYGIAFFPGCGETVVSPLLVQRLWNLWAISEFWTPRHGLGVGALVNTDGAELQIMDWKPANDRQFESLFEENLANPVWVAEHAGRAREVMLSEVEFAAHLMSIKWEKALTIPAGHGAPLISAIYWAMPSLILMAYHKLQLPSAHLGNWIAESENSRWLSL
ncbi:hypothetical protein [Paraburkholderia solitsugae]|nr:hypothetical protein [Paraburkholderia solitsugae]